MVRPNLLRRVRRRMKLAGYLALLLFVGVNALAFMHARAMTHFAPTGIRPPKPWQMSASQKARALFFGVTVPRPTNTFTPAKYDLPFGTHRLKPPAGIHVEAC